MKSIVRNSEMKKNLARFMFAGMAVLFIAGCNKTEMEEQEEAKMDIPAVLEYYSNSSEPVADGNELKSFSMKKQPPRFNTLLTALFKTRLISTVAKSELTIFAPTDEAFAKLGLNPRNIGSVPNLKEILLYHVVSGRVYSKDLKNGFTATLNGAAVEVKLEDGVMINNADVIYANIRAFNGVIHVIDEVLLPPTKNIVELAQSFAPEFSILVDAVVKAGLAETLTKGSYTVFAPTNAAFVKLLEERKVSSLEDLIKKIGIDGLKNVLLYHVVGGRVYSSDLVSGPVKAANGSSFNVNVSNLTITDANLRVSSLVPSLLNVQATNGVIHVIDRVILP